MIDLAQLARTSARTLGMLLQLEPFGGIALIWPSWELSMLVDPYGECWLVWHGKPVQRRAIPKC